MEFTIIKNHDEHYEIRDENDFLTHERMILKKDDVYGVDESRAGMVYISRIPKFDENYDLGLDDEGWDFLNQLIKSDVIKITSVN